MESRLKRERGWSTAVISRFDCNHPLVCFFGFGSLLRLQHEKRKRMRPIQSKFRLFAFIAFVSMVFVFSGCSPKVSRIYTHIAPNGMDELEIELTHEEMILLARAGDVTPISKELRVPLDAEQLAAMNARKYKVTWGNRKVLVDASSVNLSVELSTR